MRGQGDDALRQAGAVLVEIDQTPMTSDVLDAAGALPLPLRWLDAVHLASAIHLRERLSAFVTDDRRLLAAAEEVGLPVAVPGAP
ncbi:PIN domain [Streptoalloteichus tenebrarius]|uniref:PIN domain n=1 Tax=Streptoalloteichus tenebrarius (strain ATCC 17920 / DSM 40477 / JCM 4838 / CBS 697.72 / NBRC 16177 / NCIMB 11028 / NRRL B-12390 / A12253. 1 / ISP 5477) TaxID=1933 RepID=A0ABT1HZ15_STRSD|nr:PIN domain [Streptoalloteichus tenebrarius]